MIKIIEKAKGFCEKHESAIEAGVYAGLGAGFVIAMAWAYGCGAEMRHEQVAATWNAGAYDQARLDNAVIETLCMTSGLDESKWVKVEPIQLEYKG